MNRISIRKTLSFTVFASAVWAYLIKAAGVIGLAPALDHCAGCGAGSGLVRFSFAEGGVQCENCRTANAYALRDGLTTYMARLSHAELGDLPEADASLSREAMGVARRFVEYHLERRLVSPAVLDG